MKSQFLVFGIVLVWLPSFARAQDALSAIDRARLYQSAPGEAVPAVDENGNAIGAVEPSDDDSFGAQMILKEQPRVRPFSLTAGTAVYFTNNVALTRRATQDDVFAVLSAAGSWSHSLHPGWDLAAGLQAATFRYNRSSVLDFDNFGAGAGLTWSPPQARGFSLSGRYDFTELLNRHGREILRDHQLSLGAQKIFVLGRAHAISVGALGTVGFSTPQAAQRDQAGLFAGYQLQMTRALQTDVFYRIAGQFYNEGDRVDLNQVFSWNVRYRLKECVEASFNFTYGGNRSNRDVFDYDSASTGGGLALTIRF